MVSKRGVGGFCEKYSPLSESVAHIPVELFFTFKSQTFQSIHVMQQNVSLRPISVDAFHYLTPNVSTGMGRREYNSYLTDRKSYHIIFFN